MLKQEQVKTPELDKMLAVQDDSQKIGGFLQWLTEQEIVLAEWSEDVGCRSGGEYINVDQTTEGLLAKYFGIDLDKCEPERQALLDAVREDNQLLNDAESHRCFEG